MAKQVYRVIDSRGRVYLPKEVRLALGMEMLLAGCETQAPAAPSATDTPDMEEIIQQSVDEAVREKMAEYEEEQKKKDEEIARLKDQIEDLTGQLEVPPEKADAESSTPESRPESSSPQAEAPSQPKPESTAPTQQVKASTLNEGTVFEGCQVTVNDWTTPAVSSGGRDWPISTWYFWGPGEVVLGSISGDSMDKISRKYAASTNYDPDIDWSIWYADAFNEYRNLDGGGNASSATPSKETPYENENSQQAGVLSEENALEVIRLTNEEREVLAPGHRGETPGRLQARPYTQKHRAEVRQAECGGVPQSALSYPQNCETGRRDSPPAGGGQGSGL